MSLAVILSAFITLNIAVAIAFLWLRGSWSVYGAGRNGRAKPVLVQHYFAISAVILFTVAQPLLPRSEVFAPAAKVWSAESPRSFRSEGSSGERAGYYTLSGVPERHGVRGEIVISILSLMVIFMIGVGIRSVSREISGLLRIRRRAFRVRKLGSVSVFFSEDIKVPFSAWLPGRTDVVLPASLIGRCADLRIAVAHEFQHHRHGDTKWVYALWLLRGVCIANPLAHLWVNWISELQEFACDEALIDQNKVESRRYARCLVEVAETANGWERAPACATGLLFHSERNRLKRRIERMISMRTEKKKTALAFTLGLAMTALIAGAAYATNGFVQDRRITMVEAQKLAKRAQQSAEFPIVVNDLVLRQLNRFVGTPEGREFMRNALQRMENYRTVVDMKIAEYAVPRELIVLPIAESGYKNLTEGESNTYLHAAGLWQFIPSTARNFGMHVSGQKDERLDVTLSTDAALRYLQANKLRFGSWHLAVLAYNMGESAVQKAINETGSRDAWALIRRGYEGDKDYLAKVIAAMLVMKNPETLD